MKAELFPFSAAPGKAGLRADRVLNYIWIGRPGWGGHDAGQAGGRILCDAPLHYLDKAFENARAYADTNVQLWLDLRALDMRSQFFLASHIAIFAPSNVTVQHLHTIRGYNRDGFFNPDGKQTIWAQADVARLLVAEHCFETSRVETVFYADFDVEDVALDGQETAAALARHHMAFGFAPNGKMENSYFAFDRKGLSFLNYLHGMTRYEIEAGRAPNGYKPLHVAVAQRYDGDMEVLRASAKVPLSGTAMAHRHLYTDMDLVFSPAKRYDMV